jgi:hypothetical protein
MKPEPPALDQDVRCASIMAVVKMQAVLLGTVHGSRIDNKTTTNTERGSVPVYCIERTRS